MIELLGGDYNVIIIASLIIILSFFFGELAKKTNVPSVLMLIVLGIALKFGIDKFIGVDFDFGSILGVLGTVGLIMIVLEAALELELKREKLLPIGKALLIALIGLVASAWVAAEILYYFIDGMDKLTAWIYATPLSILSSAIIIPSVSRLKESKKEFHIYESTFSDILGIMMFYFLKGLVTHHPEHDELASHTTEISSIGSDSATIVSDSTPVLAQEASTILSDSTSALSELHSAEIVEASASTMSKVLTFGGTVLLTVILSLIISYIIVLIFQRIKTHTKLFLLIAVLLLLYAIGKKMSLSSLIIILIFGLLIANMKLFFRGFLKKWLDYKEAKHIYEGLHVVTMETAFVVRTFFFVIFGITISLSSLASLNVALISLLIIASIYLIRFVILRIFIGRDLFPQLFIAPRGLITILLFYSIPSYLQVDGFDTGILLFVIIGTSLIMTIAMVIDKNRTGKSVNVAKSNPIGYEKWVAPELEDKN